MKQLISLPFCMICLGIFGQSKDSLPKTDTAAISKTKQLKEVVITSKKPFIEQQIDKTVVNVQADIAAIGSSAFEILQKAPGLSITNEDIINMSGKAGVNVLIDGRPTQMSARDLANFLRSLPGSSIEKIELISNPSARFDAQGNAGIINIRLKKNRLRGTNGNITAGYAQNIHYRSNAAFTINHRQGKLNAFANIGVNNNLQHTDGFINRLVTVDNITRQFNNTTVDKDRNVSHNARAGIDFYASKKSTFGVLFTGNGNWNPFNTPGTTNISSNGVVDSSLATSNDNLYKNGRYNTNLNYKYEDSTGTELNIDADYTWFKNTNSTQLGTDYLNKSGNRYNYTANNLDVATRIDVYALKADYSKLFRKPQVKLEAGIKLSDVNTRNDLYATILQQGHMQPDTGRSNQFNYKENIYAAYANIGRQVKKFEFQLGLRLEHSVVKGISTDLKNAVIKNPDTSYLNLFPSAFLSYKINEKNQLAFSYGKRINRPDYQSLNPFETIYDIYTAEKGNPYLKPQYTSNYELKYTWRYAFNVAAGYNHTKNYSQSVTTQTGQQTLATTDNIGTLDNAYLTISAPLPITKWWEGYINITGFFNHYKGQLPNGILDQKTFGMNYYIQQNFKLGKGWSTQLSSWFNAGTTEAIYKTSALGSLDWSIKKMLFSEKASLRFTFSDIFNTQQWKQTVQFANMDFSYRRKWESRGIRLQFSWSFGKSKFQARERTTNQDADRIKVKN